MASTIRDWVEANFARGLGTNMPKRVIIKKFQVFIKEELKFVFFFTKAVFFHSKVKLCLLPCGSLFSRQCLLAKPHVYQCKKIHQNHKQISSITCKNTFTWMFFLYALCINRKNTSRPVFAFNCPRPLPRPPFTFLNFLTKWPLTCLGRHRATKLLQHKQDPLIKEFAKVSNNSRRNQSIKINKITWFYRIGRNR